MENCLLWEGPHSGARREGLLSLGSWRNNVWGTDHNPHSLFPCAIGGEEVELGRRGWWWKGHLRSHFTSCYHAPILLWINSNNISNSSLFCPWLLAEFSLSVLISTHEPFTIFSLPSPVAGGNVRETLGGAWHPPRVKPLCIPTWKGLIVAKCSRVPSHIWNHKDLKVQIFSYAISYSWKQFKL